MTRNTWQCVTLFFKEIGPYWSLFLIVVLPKECVSQKKGLLSKSFLCVCKTKHAKNVYCSEIPQWRSSKLERGEGGMKITPLAKYQHYQGSFCFKYYNKVPNKQNIQNKSFKESWSCSEISENLTICISDRRIWENHL